VLEVCDVSCNAVSYFDTTIIFQLLLLCLGLPNQQFSKIGYALIRFLLGEYIYVFGNIMSLVPQALMTMGVVFACQ